LAKASPKPLTARPMAAVIPEGESESVGMGIRALMENPSRSISLTVLPWVSERCVPDTINCKVRSGSFWIAFSKGSR